MVPLRIVSSMRALEGLKEGAELPLCGHCASYMVGGRPNEYQSWVGMMMSCGRFLMCKQTVAGM